MLAFGLCLSAAGVAATYTNDGVAEAGAASAAGRVARTVPATIVTAMACSGFILLLTPTGGAAVAALALMGAGGGGHAGRGAADRDPWTQDQLSAARGGRQPNRPACVRWRLLVAYRAAFAVTIGAVVVAAASLVVRFRRARGVERQQLRWVASATILVALLSVVNLAARRWAPMLWRRWRVVSIRRSCRRRSGRPSCGIGCTTWTASSAGPWPTGS